NTPFYLILTDFDYFSRINTNLGYPLCDAILIRGGEILQNHGKVEHIARYYGDQFAILFRGSKQEVSHYIEKKQHEIRTISHEMNIDVAITISSGIIHYPGDCERVENLMANVELALREAKKVDRSAYHFFNSASVRERRRLELIRKTLPEALRREEIDVFFQPKISVSRGCVTGMEALVRWNHPELGPLPPRLFIDIAEESGRIVEVGEYVMDKSMQHLARCRREGITDVSVSVNISPMHLLVQQFPEKLIAKTREYNLAPQQIYLEITENILLEGDVESLLRRIQNAGFHLSLDDFGTGYSSLNYLRQFSFDELKIDKCFTDGLLKGEREIQMFGTLLSIAGIFNMKTVIEGVEDREQVDMITQLGAGEIQGCYYSQALAPQECISFIKKSAASP
ncbi:MAG: putative bifunctional diguanylate cyclase/phosphodiesterase, partial [Fibrobacterota bacterium]